MKRPDKPVIVEVKRGGRKTLVKAVKPKARTVLTEAPPERPQNEAWRAADRLFTRKTATEPSARTTGKDVPARRVLQSLVEETPPAPASEAPREKKADRVPARTAEPARRRGRPPKVPAAELRRPAPDEAEVARALETLGRLEANRKAAATAPRVVGPDLVERRRSSAEPLVPTQKRRGRPPKPRPEAREPSFAERVWTSSKDLLEDDAPEAAPVVARHVAPVAVPRAHVAHAASAPVETRERVSFRTRLGLAKPGERWKRRLRGYAR